MASERANHAVASMIDATAEELKRLSELASEQADALNDCQKDNEALRNHIRVLEKETGG